VGRVQYDPYGEVLTSTLPVTLTDRLFTGARFDGTIGLYQMGARWYDPALGRWFQADTIVPEPGNPQALNRYAYVYNNPLRFVDPTGHGGPVDWLTGQIIAFGSSGDVGRTLVVAGSTIVHHINKQNQTIFFPGPDTTTGERLAASVEIGVGTVVIAAIGVEIVAGTLTTAAASGGAAEVVATTTTATTAACADGDCTNEAGLAGKLIETNWTVIGRYSTYLEKAKQIGANVLDIPPDEWNALGSRAAQWARNVEFLDEAIARGDSFCLATPFIEGIKDAGSFYQAELIYLLQNGYELVTLYGQEWLVSW
jgi:RHS repeat-associated protein